MKQRSRCWFLFFATCLLLTIVLTAVSPVWSAGARLRLTIAPFNSPNYQKNYNTGGRIGYERLEDARTANIKIFHDEERKSCLTLPLAAPATKPTSH
jgi:predicted acyl esterase